MIPVINGYNILKNYNIQYLKYHRKKYKHSIHGSRNSFLYPLSIFRYYQKNGHQYPYNRQNKQNPRNNNINNRGSNPYDSSNRSQQQRRPNNKYINTNKIDYPTHKGIPVEIDEKITLDFCDEAHYSLFFREYEDVIRSFNEVEKGENPTEYDIYLYLFSLFKLTRYDDIIKYIEENRVNSDMDCRIHSIIYFSYFYLNRMDEAIESFKIMKQYWNESQLKHKKVISEYQRSKIYYSYYHILISKYPNDFNQCYETLIEQSEKYPESLTPKILNTILDFSLKTNSKKSKSISKMFLLLKSKKLSNQTINELSRYLSQQEIEILEKRNQEKTNTIEGKISYLRKESDINTGIELMEELSSMGEVDKAEDIFFMVVEDVSYFIDPYDISNRMLKIYITHNREEKINGFLEWMKKNYIYITTEGYNHLMHYYINHNDHHSVIRIFNDMIDECIEPNIFSYQMVLGSYEKINDIESVKKLLQDWKNSKIQSYYILREMYHTILRMTKGQEDYDVYIEEFKLRFPEDTVQ